MAFIFPEDKADFTAPNGVTYHHDGAKWVTKTFKADESALAEYVKTDDFEADQLRQDDAFSADQEAQDELIAENRRSIEELEVTKGPVSRYETKGTDFFLASRNGELYVNSATAASVTLISLAAFDLNGNPTRPVNDGDIIEFVEAATTRSTGQLSRFRITNGTDPQALEVVYLNGNNNFEIGHIEEVYIYPQNEETASKEYVDSNFLPLSGGELTGSLRVKNGDAKTHPQYKVSPNGGTDYATNIYTLEGPMRLRTSHTGGEGDHDGSHIVLDPDVAGGGANQTTKIYKVPTPSRDDMAANRAYVDDQTAGLTAELDKYIKKLGTNETGGEFKITNGGKTYVHVQTDNTLGLYNLQEPAHSHHAATRNYVDDAVADLATEQYVDDAVAAGGGLTELPTATTSTKGGVTAATNSGTYVPCTKMANTGSAIGVVQSSNTTKGVNYKGQACITSSSTPTASEYQQGCLVFSTSTNSLYIRT